MCDRFEGGSYKVVEQLIVVFSKAGITKKR